MVLGGERFLQGRDLDGQSLVLRLSFCLGRWFGELRDFFAQRRDRLLELCVLLQKNGTLPVSYQREIRVCLGFSRCLQIEFALHATERNFAGLF